MSLFDPIKPYLAVIKLAAFIAVVIAAFLYGRANGKEAGARVVRATELAQAKEQAKAADDLRISVQAQADRYRTQAESQAAVATQYQEALNDANRKHDRTVADLRSGAVKLRGLWQGCEVSRTGQVAPGRREPDAGTDDRAESAARIVRAAAICDAQVKGLQAIVTQERQ